MGLFNDIKDLKEPCSKCGKLLLFQTKDDFNDNLYLHSVDFRSVRYFGAICTDCRIGINYILNEDWRKRTLKDYERTEDTY